MDDSGTEGQLAMPEDKPLYPDVPWWAVLVTALVCSAFAVIATAFALKSGVTPPKGVAVPSAIGALLVDTVVFMPHILLLFGVLADMFTYDGVWSIPSLIGIMSIFLNYVFRYFWVGIEEATSEMFKKVKEIGDKGTAAVASAPAPAPRAQPTIFSDGPTGSVIARRNARLGGAKGAFSKEYDGCSVQGFEGFASEYAPQTLVVTATIFSYYVFDLVQNRGWVNSIAGVFAFIITYMGQVAILSTTNQGGCPPPTGRPQVGTASQAIRALAEGILFGGTSYGIVKTYYPTRLVSSTVSPFPRRTAADLTMGADGKMRDASGMVYVVLPNGQAVPDLSDTESRRSFGRQAATNLGTGVPATAGCDATGSVDDRIQRIRAIAGV